jgi:hypothetical protein
MMELYDCGTLESQKIALYNLKVFFFQHDAFNPTNYIIDTTLTNGQVKLLNSFDIAPNNLLLAAGTSLFEGDTFLLFWDARKTSLLGGYWESHTRDVTQVLAHHIIKYY